MSKNKKVMILPSPPNSGSIGSVTKSIGIARMLEKQGCSVCFVMGDQLGDFIAKNGFKIYPYPVPKPNGKIQKINNLVDFIVWAGMVDDDFVEASIKAELDAINDFKPDVIFAEARPSASISARICKIPSIMIASWPCHPEHHANFSNKYIKIYNDQLTKYKLPEIENLTELFFMHADVKLAPTLPELEPELQSTKGVQFVGYILDQNLNTKQLPDWYNNWIDLPQIFIYLSVSALSPELYIDIIIETFKDMPYRVICGCGFHYNLKSLPKGLENIKFERYVPVASVMKDTSLVIFHGGQDTMLTTLLYGKSSITIPGQHYERDYNASKLAELGASKKLPVHAFRPNRLKKVIHEVLEDSYISICNELKEKLKTYGGTKQCVKVILESAI